MKDKLFVEQVKHAVESYAKENVWDNDEDAVLTDFVEWLYKQYGIVYENKNGQS
jgi:hypothetical protein